ncbi:MAG: Spy/CpxP family protein refolding chaperone [Bryobacteraceae bacterium]
MNQSLTRRIMVAAFAVLTAVPTFAQGGPPQGSGSGSGTSRRLNFLAGYLSLTDTQKSQAQAIFDAADAAVQTARGTLTAAQTALRTAIKAHASDSELDRLSAAVGAIQGQITAINAKAESKFYALLTAEQKTKYDQLGSGMGPGGGGRNRRSAQE